jgi:hypothetical protein
MCYTAALTTFPMTIDEELDRLEDGIRRLKIDYDIYFNGAAKRPPNDSQWRVETLLKKLQDSSKMNFGQRFRYNTLAQRYGLFSELWRQRLKVREEGPRRTAAEIRAEQAEQRQHQSREEERKKQQKKPRPFRVDWRDPSSEPEKVEQLFTAFLEAKRRCGESTDNIGPEQFRKFVSQKTEQLKRDFRCDQVEYVVEVEAGQVKLKAKGL